MVGSGFGGVIAGRASTPGRASGDTRAAHSGVELAGLRPVKRPADTRQKTADNGHLRRPTTGFILGTLGVWKLRGIAVKRLLFMFFELFF